MLTAQDDEEIREVIGRELDAVESGTYDTLGAIPAAVEAIAVRIANQYRVVLAVKYLHERVPSAERDDAKLKLAAIWDRPRRS